MQSGEKPKEILKAAQNNKGISPMVAGLLIGASVVLIPEAHEILNRPKAPVASAAQLDKVYETPQQSPPEALDLKSPNIKILRLMIEGGDATFDLETDETMLDSGKIAFSRATDNRITPKKISTSEIVTVDLESSCFTGTAEDYMAVNEIGLSALKPGEVGLIALSGAVCAHKGFDADIAGYGSPQILPVVLEAGFDNFWPVAIHEFGHYTYQNHAGIVICADPVWLDGCIANDVNDGSSLMSYSNSPEHPQYGRFSTRELYEMQLMGRPEVVNLNTSQARRIKIGALESTEAVKLLTYNFEDKLVSFEWRQADEARYALEVRYDKHQSEASHGPADQSQDSLVLVDATFENLEESDISGEVPLGYFVEGMTVFEDESIKLELIENDGLEGAVLQFTTKTK